MNGISYIHKVMKKGILNLSKILALSMLMMSCYSYSHVVGTGPQNNEVVKKKNHYLFYGLATVKVADSKQMVGESENYKLTVEHSIFDQLLNGFTLGIYTPTTTIVKK